MPSQPRPPDEPHEPTSLASAPGMLGASLPGLDDLEGARIPHGLPPVIDAHVHLFPDRVFDAIWRWFDRHAWPIRYKLYTPQVIEFLLSRGVERIIALHYSHRPGMARELNAYMAQVCQAEPRVVGLATVLPGEPGAAAVLEEAFSAGLAGVKLHCHVQCFAPDDARLHEIYEVCERHGKPIVIHAGREPKSPAYACDPHELCSAERIERVLRDYPRLKLCVPHLGADEFDAYGRMLGRHDNLWLDTTMAVAGFLPGAVPWHLLRDHSERLLFGTDFPNIPFAWDRELGRIASAGLSSKALERILHGSARELFTLQAARG